LTMVKPTHGAVNLLNNEKSGGSVKHIICLKGRILPEVRKVSLPGNLVVEANDPKGVQGKFHIKIIDGRVEVKCEIENNISDLASHCIVKARELVSVSIDLQAFSKGWFLSTIFDEMTIFDNNKMEEVRHPIAMSETSLSAYVTALNTPEKIESVKSDLMKNINIRFAMNDLISSLSTLNYSAIAAARAIEAVRQNIACHTTPDKVAWKIMRQKLNISEECLRSVTDASKEPRHGNRGATNGNDQMKVTRIAWQVMNRYLEYKIRGGIDALPASEFPVLNYA
jgi:hypothetical protein